jgi:uncharacterized protein
MKKKTLIAIALSALLAATAAVFVFDGYGAVDDPESARCNAPAAAFGPERATPDHREIEVHFTCVGALQKGTLNLPTSAGPYRAVVWVHGSGAASDFGWSPPFVRALVRSGVAVLTYDKRGVGASEGVCCPGDDDHFNLLAADADGAVAALWSRSDIDRARIGFIGASQAGWVVPLAVSRSVHRVAFTALVDAPVTSTHEEQVYSRAAGENEQGPLSAQRKAEADRKVAATRPSGFDPAPYLQRMTVPGLWLYGGSDKSVPTTKSVAALHALRARGKDFTVRVFPDAGHGLLDGSGDPRVIAALVGWISSR